MAIVARKLVELGADVLSTVDPSRQKERESGYVVKGADLVAIGAGMGKRIVEIDATDPERIAWLERLIGTADVLIEDATSHPDEAIALDVDALRARFPELVILSASDFGRTGSFSAWRGADIVYCAINSVLSRSGLPGKPPLQAPGDIAHACAADQAVCVVLTALFARLCGGEGDLLDLSLLDASTEVFDPGYGIAGSATLGVPASKLPPGRIDASFQYPIVPCADGHMRLCILAPRQWQGMFEWMGRPAEFADPSFNKTTVRFASKELLPAIARLFADRTCAQIEEEAKRYGVPVAAVYGFDDVLANETGIARGALRPLEIAPGVVASYPEGAWEIDGRRMTLGDPAKTVTVTDDPGALWQTERRRAPTLAGFDPTRPLAGIRVLDLGVIVVGAEQGRFFADLGADVIKIESSAFIDGSRQTMDGSPMSPTFAAGHRNKRSLGLNLRDEAGKALFREMVAKADVILSNFKPGTMESLGFDYETLASINPGIITSESSAFGSSGPWRARMGYGPLVRAASGLAANWRYAGEPESFCDGLTVYPDHVAARYGIAGTLALLIRRRFTGRGGQVAASQLEISQGHLAPQIAARSLELQGHGLDGPLVDAPWGIFPCAGEDQWCAVAVQDSTQWQGFCRATGRADLAGDAALVTAAGRAAARGRIHEALNAWLATRSPTEAMEALQAEAVPAGALYRVSELIHARVYSERGLFRPASHPLLAEGFYLANAPVRSVLWADPPEAAAPILGQNTDEVLAEWLGLDEPTLLRLHETGVLEAVKAARPTAA
jgi:crotonobetainyl-CoA:carnitine CoA-transferase CaiB-like acyl-CoA transferase